MVESSNRYQHYQDCRVGPTFYWRVTDANGTVGSWSSKLLTPPGGSSGWTTCAGVTSCDWTTTLEDIERGASVEYYITVKDTSTAATGTNTNTTTTSSFEVGDPNKIFVVEWHDVGYSGTTNLCTYQALFYDVTNEIEFHYDTGCKASYDYATVGYQDQTRTKGATVRGSQGYIYGANPHTNNYRIGTDSSGHSYETFDLGMKELPSYDTTMLVLAMDIHMDGTVHPALTGIRTNPDVMLTSTCLMDSLSNTSEPNTMVLTQRTESTSVEWVTCTSRLMVQPL